MLAKVLFARLSPSLGVGPRHPVGVKICGHSVLTPPLHNLIILQCDINDFEKNLSNTLAEFDITTSPPLAAAFSSHASSAPHFENRSSSTMVDWMLLADVLAVDFLNTRSTSIRLLGGSMAALRWRCPNRWCHEPMKIGRWERDLIFLSPSPCFSAHFDHSN